jgi:hypothetical protein
LGKKAMALMVVAATETGKIIPSQDIVDKLNKQNRKMDLLITICGVLLGFGFGAFVLLLAMWIIREKV